MGGTSSTEKFASKLDAACELEGFKREDIVTSSSAADCVYLAVKLPSGEVTGVVCIVETRKYEGEVETYAKAMSEGMHPYYYEASAKVLDALSPTSDEDALAWRAKCRKRLARKTSLKVGDVFTVKVAITFKGKRGIEVGAFASVREVKRTKVVMLAPSFGLFAMRIDQMDSYLTPAEVAPAPTPAEVAPAPTPAEVAPAPTTAEVAPTPPARTVTTVEDALTVLADANADAASIDAALALLA